MVALQGTLDTFSVPDVLRLLASTRKRGRLLLHGSRGEGSVWLDDGRVVEVTVAAGPSVAMGDALFEILRAADGAFAFEAGLAAPDASAGQDVEELLSEVEERVAEWQQIEAVVPSLRAFVALNPELPDGPVTLDAETWRVVVAIAGGATVAELAGDLGLAEVPACRAVRAVVELGIAICAPAPPEGWDEGVPAAAADPSPAEVDELAAAVAAAFVAAEVGAEETVPDVAPAPWDDVPVAAPAWDDAPVAAPAWDDAPVAAPAWDDAPAALAWADDPAPSPARWSPAPAAVLPPAPAWFGDARAGGQPDAPTPTPAPFSVPEDDGPDDGWSTSTAWEVSDQDVAPRTSSPAAHDTGLSPQAAHALAAVAGDESVEASADAGGADEPGQRGLLVKFLSSVRP